MERARFATLFKELHGYLEAAKLQGLKWNKNTYEVADETTAENIVVELLLDKNTYLKL